MSESPKLPNPFRWFDSSPEVIRLFQLGDDLTVVRAAADVRGRDQDLQLTAQLAPGFAELCGQGVIVIGHESRLAAGSSPRQLIK